MGAKTLIAIVNARHRLEWREAIRKTWLPLVPRDLSDAFFFQGRGESVPPKEDEVFLDCDDSYLGLPNKVQEIVRWALTRDYDYCLKCDDDVVLDPHRFLQSDYSKYDFTGRANRPPNPSNPFWVPMGFNYVMSRRAMALVAAAELPHRWNGDNDDERWVSEVLNAGGIGLHDNVGHRLHYGSPQTRPLRARDPNAPNRALRPPQQLSYSDTAFSWCIFLEGNSGTTIPTEFKIQEFHNVFNLSVKARGHISSV